MTLHLSPSRLDTFAQCGLRYRFQYVEHLPSPPTKDTTLGNIGHRALELLFNEPQWDRTPERLEAALDQSVNEHADELGEVFGEHFVARVECVFTASEYAQRVFSIMDPSVITGDTEGTLRVQTDSWDLTGRYDLLVHNDDGTVTLIDWKFGKPVQKRNDRDKLRPLMLYAGMYEILHPGVSVGEVRLVYLRSTPKGTVPVVVSALVDSHEVDGGFLRVEAMAAAIQRGLDAGFRPKPGVLCHWCCYADRCPEGTQYIEAHPRKSP
jgi:putative RecB family exonuclease